jgi:tRNA(Ile)-lysidine synthase
MNHTSETGNKGSDYIAEIENKVFTYMEENHMLSLGDKVVVGVSGGADSVCLLFMLLKWAEKHPLEIVAAHIDHGIREEAGEDARFVEGLCRKHGLLYCIKRIDVKEFANINRMSEEEAGRRVRYEAFEHFAAHFGADKIAVAHNSNDRAETMLFNLFRGSGLTGLGSIRPVRGKIIRPLLCLERHEVEGYLKGRGLAYRSDSTNDLDDYTRNRIRHHILPFVEDCIAVGSVPRMAKTADIILETEDYLEIETGHAYKTCVLLGGKGEEGYRVMVPAFMNLHSAIQNRLLLMLVKNLSPGRKDITYRHIHDFKELFIREGNRSICLPRGLCCTRQYEEVLLEKGRQTDCFKQTLIRGGEGETLGTISLDTDIPLGGFAISVQDVGVLEFKVLYADEVFCEKCKISEHIYRYLMY